MHLRVDADHTKWLVRPLTEEQLAYAVADVELIALLYQLFLERGYIDDATLRRQSRVYTSLYKSGRPNNANTFARHSLLPLDILDRPEDHEPPPFVCVCCDRHLRESCFAGSALLIGGSHRCSVCEAVFRYIQLRKKQGRAP